MIRFVTFASTFACLASIAACSAAPAEPVETVSGAQVGSCTDIDDHQVEHACIHSLAGPFRSVTASDSAPPDVSREHTTYRVTLTAVSNAVADADAAAPANAPDAAAPANAADAAAPISPTFGGSVSFVPGEDGEYAIYTSSSAAQLSASDAHGKRASFECSTAIPEDLCRGFVQLRMADLEHGHPVTLTFESPEPGVLLLIEHVGHGHGHGHGHDDDHAETH